MSSIASMPPEGGQGGIGWCDRRTNRRRGGAGPSTSPTMKVNAGACRAVWVARPYRGANDAPRRACSGRHRLVGGPPTHPRRLLTSSSTRRQAVWVARPLSRRRRLAARRVTRQGPRAGWGAGAGALPLTEKKFSPKNFPPSSSRVSAPSTQELERAAFSRRGPRSTAYARRRNDW
jgi:hypothetical protein